MNTSIQVASVSKVVSVYGDRAPEGLEELDQQIERIANLTPLVTPECTKTIRVQGSFPNGPFKTLPNESYNRPPTLRYLIQEDGTVSDATITRSSGVADMDKMILDRIAQWKYKPRPAGCGVIENETTAIIHLGWFPMRSVGVATVVLATVKGLFRRLPQKLALAAGSEALQKSE